MMRTAEVRSTQKGYELRVNGRWMASSPDDIAKLLNDGWKIHWNPTDYRLTPYGIEYIRPVSET